MLHRLPVCDAILLTMLAASAGAAGREQQPAFVVRRPTIIAFFPPVTQDEVDKDPATNDSLADFQLYATQVREPLQGLGIDFHVVFARSFRVRIGAKVTTFRPDDALGGYYLVAPGKKPHIEYGVATDVDLLQIARDYFGMTKL